MYKKNLYLKKQRKKRRESKVRKKVIGTAQKPRLAVYRSLKHIYAQIIDDEKGTTLVCSNDLQIKGLKGNKTDKAAKIGGVLAEKCLEKGIKVIVFDRHGCKYHGRIKALAKKARDKGLKF
jgi:large subunit ribosomal protein L18